MKHLLVLMNDGKLEDKNRHTEKIQ
jgi:hypothetical protein